MSTGRAVLRGGLWTIVVTIIGTFPLWLKWFICIASRYSYCMDEVVKEGVIVVFVTALVGTILTDLCLCTEKMNLPKEVKAIIYVLIPFLVFLLMTAAFVVFVIEPHSVHLELLGKMQIVAFAITLIYSTFIKSVHFLKEDI
jgi:hypothetical protein